MPTKLRIQWVPEGREVGRSGYNVNYSSPYSAEVKIEWSLTSPSIFPDGVDRVNVIFTFLLEGLSIYYLMTVYYSHRLFGFQSCEKVASSEFERTGTTLAIAYGD